jgi:FixJ family two-component response regulator
MPDRIPVRAVRNGGLDFIEVPTRDEQLIAALLRERAGYVVRNLPERIAAVDVELHRLGHQPNEEARPVRRRGKK